MTITIKFKNQMERHVNLIVHRTVLVKRNACFNLLCSFRETKKKKNSS